MSDDGSSFEPNRRAPGTGLATGALICGIISIAFALFSPLICWIIGVVGLVLFSHYRNAGGTDSFGKVGRICSIVGIGLGLAVFAIQFFINLMGTAGALGA